MFGCDMSDNLKKACYADTNIQVLLLLIATFKVIIQGADGILRLATPEEHEAWCPFGIQIEMIRLETQSRKSSATNLSRKSSCKPPDRLLFSLDYLLTSFFVLLVF